MDAFITGLLSGGFAILGVVVTLWWSARREDQRFKTETALELAELERFIWGKDWVALWVALQRQDARLAVAGVPADLIQMLSRITRACWRYNREGVERSGENEGGIAVDLLDASRQLQRAVRAHLLTGRRGSARDKLSREAIAYATSVLDEHEHEDPGW